MPFPSFKKARGPVVYSAEEIPGAMSLKVVTWNVGNAEPNNDLSGLLGPRGGDGVDILAIGLQECQYDPADSKAPLTAAQGVSGGCVPAARGLPEGSHLAARPRLVAFCRSHPTGRDANHGCPSALPDTALRLSAIR